MSSESKSNEAENDVQQKQDHIKERLKEMGVTEDSVRPEKSAVWKYSGYSIVAFVAVLIVVLWYDSSQQEVANEYESQANIQNENNRNGGYPYVHPQYQMQAGSYPPPQQQVFTQTSPWSSYPTSYWPPAVVSNENQPAEDLGNKAKQVEQTQARDNYQMQAEMNAYYPYGYYQHPYWQVNAWQANGAYTQMNPRAMQYQAYSNGQQGYPENYQQRQGYYYPPRYSGYANNGNAGYYNGWQR